MIGLTRERRINVCLFDYLTKDSNCTTLLKENNTT